MRISSLDAHGSCVNLKPPSGPIRDLHNLCFTGQNEAGFLTIGGSMKQGVPDIADQRVALFSLAYFPLYDNPILILVASLKNSNKTGIGVAPIPVLLLFLPSS